MCWDAVDSVKKAKKEKKKGFHKFCTTYGYRYFGETTKKKELLQTQSILTALYACGRCYIRSFYTMPLP